jgi:2-polyprenyl-3-methyl-5-hydroxy-6-metoxy-1,4-benzoquinol methylase
MSKEFWEKNAESWNQAIRSELVESRKITNPAMISEILKTNPQSVLDLGCGEGWIASQLLPRGIKYTGFDFSENLIELAAKAYPQGVFKAIGYDEMIRTDVKADFDAVLFNFSLFDENLTALLRKAASLLEPKGTMLIQTLHPRALDPYEDGWRTEDFKTFPVSFSGTMRWYGRTLESWEKLFLDSGLEIFKTVEPVHPETKKTLSIVFVLKLSSRER